MPDGSIEHIYNLSHSLRDEAGKEEVGSIMDITERKVAEEAIREAKRIWPKLKGSVTRAASAGNLIQARLSGQTKSIAFSSTTARLSQR